MPKTKRSQQLAAYGRVRQKKAAARLYPDRAQYDLRMAARRLNLRLVACEVEIWNASATGKDGKARGAPQWVDTIAKHPTLGLLALDVADEDYRYGPRFADEKRAALSRRGIPYFVTPAAPLFEMQARLIRWVRELEKGKK